MKNYFAIALLLLARMATAQDMLPATTTVAADDPIGRQLADRVKQAIQASDELVYISENKNAAVEVVITTKDRDRDSVTQVATIYSVTLNFRDRRTDLWTYVASTVGEAGPRAIDQAALDVMAFVDDWMRTIRSFRSLSWTRKCLNDDDANEKNTQY